MTRRDFELIAATIRLCGETAHSQTAQATVSDLANRFARALAVTNPAFDRARFLRACGVEG